MQQNKNNHRRLTTQQQEDLIKEYSWLIKIIARAVKRKMLLDVVYEEEDLFSLGVIGLLDAAKRYDPSRGAKFKTYAKIKIFGAMIDDIRKTNWVPRSVFKNIKLAEHLLYDSNLNKGGNQLAQKIAENLQIDIRQAHQILMDIYASQILRIDDQKSKREKDSIVDLLEKIPAKPEDNDPYLKYVQNEQKLILQKAVNELETERERRVIELYYGFGLRMKAIGEILGITESRVSQIRLKAVTLLKEKLNDHHFFAEEYRRNCSANSRTKIAKERGAVMDVIGGTAMPSEQKNVTVFPVSEEKRTTPKDSTTKAYRPVREELYQKALELVVTHQRVSIVFLKKHLHINGGLANKLIARLEQEQIVSPSRGKWKRREVLKTSKPQKSIRQLVEDFCTKLKSLQEDVDMIKSYLEKLEKIEKIMKT